MADEDVADELFRAVSDAIAVASVDELDEYAHLTIEFVNAGVKAPELLTGLLRTNTDRGVSLHDAYSMAVPAAFLHVAVQMLCEGLKQDAHHVCHEIMFTILGSSPEMRKKFWAEHAEHEKEKSDKKG
jgi:hypothetical protein